MRDMMTKFGAQVESFRYAFVLPKHAEGWEENAFHSTAPESAAPAPAPHLEADGTPRRRAGDKRPTYIEIKPA